MFISVRTDKYQKTRARNGASYWRFNVFIDAGEFGFISMGWRYQNGKTQAPYEIINGKFYTNFRVSRAVAKAIYADVIQRVGELEGREIPFDDKMWRAPIIGQSSFEKTLPAYWAETYGPNKKAEVPKVAPKEDPRGIEVSYDEYMEYENAQGPVDFGEEVFELPEEEGETVAPVALPRKADVAPAADRLKKFLEDTESYGRRPN